MSHRDIRDLFGTPDEWHQGSFTEVKHGVIDVALGVGIFGAIGGSAAGPLYGPYSWTPYQEATIDFGSAIILGCIGAFVGAVGGVLIGTIVGGIGEIICGKLGLDKLLRTKLGGRLDGVWGRLLYGGLLGAIGGPIILSRSKIQTSEVSEDTFAVKILDNQDNSAKRGTFGDFRSLTAIKIWIY